MSGYMHKYVIFKMYNESGHLFPAFHLAKQLQATGEFLAVFVSEQKFKGLIEEQGFVFETEMHYDNISAHRSYIGAKSRAPLVTRIPHLLNARKSITQDFIDFTAKIIEKYQPVLLLVDELHFNYVVAMHDQGVPIVTLSTYALSLESPYVPPPNASQTPRRSRSFRILNFFLWRRVYLERFIQQLSLQINNPGADFYYKLLCQYKNYKRKHRNNKKFYWIDDTTVDKLVLVPEFLDFEHPKKNGIFYINDCVDINRVEKPFDWSLFDSRPIIYSSLGTQTLRDIDKATRIYKKIISAFTRKTQYNLIISTPEAIKHQLASIDLPQHISLATNAPQLTILKRSSLAIIHGGMGSIKECLRFAVPMLILPLNKDVDQLGNATRVCVNNYGLQMNTDDLNAKDLSDNVDHILSSPLYSENVKSAQKNIEDHELEKPFLLYAKNKIAKSVN